MSFQLQFNWPIFGDYSSLKCISPRFTKKHLSQLLRCNFYRQGLSCSEHNKLKTEQKCGFGLFFVCKTVNKWRQTSCGLACRIHPIQTAWHRGPHDPTVQTDASASSECTRRLHTCHRDPILSLNNRHCGMTTKFLENSVSLSLRFNGHYPGEPGLAGVYWSKGWWRWWWQLDYWSYKSCKAPVKSSPPTNQHPVFYRPDALPVTQPTVSKLSILQMQHKYCIKDTEIQQQWITDHIQWQFKIYKIKRK